jgi:acetyl esterase
MPDDSVKKISILEDPGIRDFMIAGANFYPADAVNVSMAEQRAFHSRHCVHFRRSRPPTVETNDLKIAGVPCRRYVRRGVSGAPAA